jgi:putative peptidoglycan lipid II flippase
LLTLPAAAALSVCAPAFVTAFFVGGKMSQAQGDIMAGIVAALVCGLPAYVLVKVFQPAFFSREDTRTPVVIATAALAINIGINFLVVPRYGIVGLAAATAFTSSLNVATLYAVLHRRGWFRMPLRLVSRIVRQLAASGIMTLALWALLPHLSGYYAGGALQRAGSLLLLVIVGATAFFAAAWLVGALDNSHLAQLRGRKAAPEPVDLSE